MKKLALILSFSFLVTSGFARQSPDPEILSEKIHQVLADFGENLNIGIYVKDAKTGNTLFKKDVDRYFMPASSQKLFTAFAALDYLGHDFSYQTQLFADYTKVKKDTLNDNLYLQFSGDPTLTVAKLDSLIRSLAEADIHQIKGKVIIDDSGFDQMTMSPGTSWEDQDFCWGAPLSSLIINQNCVTATINPAEKVDEQAKLELPEYPQSMDFVNQVVTKPSTEKNCQLKVKRTDKKTYTISGCIKSGSKPRRIEMAINDPRSNTEAILKYLLKKNQIKVSSGFEFKHFAPFPKAFARQDSPPLKTLVSTMLKESDNTIANSLFKTMGADFAHEAGSFANGNQAVREILTSTIDLAIPKTTLIDGSGLSRYNFLTLEQILNLEQKIFLSPKAADFIASLPIAGVDGTLKYRLKNPLTLGKIFAKTGSETAVASLSGFLETKNKQILLFSIVINGFTAPASKYTDLIDKLCLVLAEAN